MSNLLLLSRLSMVFVISIVNLSCKESMPGKDSNLHLTVFKDKNCQCCNKWITHLTEHGFIIDSQNENQNSLSSIKQSNGITSKLRSCHTSVNKDGQVFEGHIPAKHIRQFINEKPEGAIGLSVPAMPTGTPGMEFGEMLQAYKIYLLRSNGSVEKYAEINTAEEQL